jgi:pimeloyl-ACP methyl ester carboxylesterase
VRKKWAVAGVLLIGLGAVVVSQTPEIAAGGLLHPRRSDGSGTTPTGCVDREFAGEAVALRGWSCSTAAERNGTIVYLHGIADNRSSSVGVITRYLPRGFDVIAYDGRAHGQSTGDFCTYGVWERRDLRAVIGTLPPGPVILIGTSLGGAVAVQAAAEEPRVTAVVAAEVFSDLETVARERAPRLLPEWVIRRAFALAQDRAEFLVAQASPVALAPRVTAPVLLIHGSADVETAIAHSERVLQALAGPAALIRVEGAGHNQSLGGQVWDEIDSWIQKALALGGADRRRPTKEERSVRFRE